MNNNKNNTKSPASLVVGDMFTHGATRYTVTGTVTVAESKAHGTRRRMLVPTSRGDLRIPCDVPLKMV